MKLKMAVIGDNDASSGTIVVCCVFSYLNYAVNCQIFKQFISLLCNDVN